MPEKMSERLAEMRKLKEEKEAALWGKGLQKIRAEMALNRRQMASTIEEIKKRIPTGVSVGEIARERLREEIVGRAGGLVKYEDRLFGAMRRYEHEFFSELRQTAEGVFMKHPILSGLMGLGVAWLVSELLNFPRSGYK